MNEYSKYLILKSAIEDLFGSEAWYALKESNRISAWKKYSEMTLRALELAIQDTVEIYDEEWLSDVLACIDRGIAAVKSHKSIDEIVGTLAGTLIEVSFLQVGIMPRRKGSSRKFPLRRGNWKLNSHRSVAYLQTTEQKEASFWSKQQRLIGVQKQMALHDEFRRSKSRLWYSEWCTQRDEDDSKDGA